MSGPPSGSDGGEDARKTTKENAGHSATDEAQKASSSSGAPNPPIPTIKLPRWAMWAIAAVVLLGIPFHKKMARIGGILEKVVKAVAVVKKVAEDVGDSVPEDWGIADELEFIEHVADEVVEGAEQAEAFVEKIEDIKEKVEDTIESIANEQEVKKGNA